MAGINKYFLNGTNKKIRYSFRFNIELMQELLECTKNNSQGLADLTACIRNRMSYFHYAIKDNRDKLVLELSDYYPGDIVNDKMYKFNLALFHLEEFQQDSISIGLEPENVLRKLIMKYISENKTEKENIEINHEE